MDSRAGRRRVLGRNPTGFDVAEKCTKLSVERRDARQNSVVGRFFREIDMMLLGEMPAKFQNLFRNGNLDSC
jgi:hypothetical protein